MALAHLQSSLPAVQMLAALLAASLVYLATRRLRRPDLPLPPGPPGRFLIGNFGQLSADHPEQDYMRWGKEYDSDVIHISVLGQHMICLNSAEAASELLDRRGANYCDRPRFTLFEVMGWGLTLTFLRWGPQFKLHRGLFQQTFAQSHVKIFRPMQQHEARKAVAALLDRPDAWEEATLLMATSIIFRIAFGREIADASSPYCAMAAAASDATTGGGIAGTSLVDVVPLARFLPDGLHRSAALRHARRSRVAIRTIHDAPWADALRAMEAGTAPPSFMRTHYERLHGLHGHSLVLTERDIKGATGAVFIAGGNSTWGTVLSNLLFLAKHPDAQRAVCEELDAVLDGGARLPVFDDRPALGRLDRFMQEVLRVLPLNPLVIPHKSLRADVFRGMRIPAGSVVFANAAAMGVDPRVYRDPGRFDPDRFARGEPYPPGNFGFGRRKCPGNFLAMATVYIFLSTLLAVFEVEKAMGPDGQPIEPEPAVAIGLGGHPSPFVCKLRVRNPGLAKLLAAERSQAQASGA